MDAGETAFTGTALEAIQSVVAEYHYSTDWWEIERLEENTAWGFVRIGQNPEYAGMYIIGDVGAVMYVARVKEIVPASEAILSRSLESYTGDQAPFDQTKRSVVFEPESLYELSDPIPLATRVPYGLRYTDLIAVRSCRTRSEP